MITNRASTLLSKAPEWNIKIKYQRDITEPSYSFTDAKEKVEAPQV